MATETTETATVHGGRIVARRLRAHGVTKLFTLSGGHLFSIYDGCREEGIDVVDVRHEQTAAFAAEGWAKVTREPGVCALTAGPGVTNGLSAIGGAFQNHSPMVVLAGRAPAMRWGQGSLQEIDHVPFVRPLTRFAATPDSTAEIAGLVDDAFGAALGPHSGPAFVDFPLDHVFMEAEDPGLEGGLPTPHTGPGADEAQIARAAALLRDAERPVIMAGTNLYWGHGEDALRALAEAGNVPVLLNGNARGCLPADHPLFFSRARSAALKEADVALVVGVPMDFRLGFGASFGEDTDIVVVDVAEPERDHPRPVAAELYGALPATLGALAHDAGDASERRGWIEGLRAQETEKREAERAELSDDRAPLHPMRLYAELDKVLDRDAIVIGDGGDFVSYAGRVVNSYEPGCWLDPGPFGCLGTGPGYALAAKLAHPDRQVVLLLGDGAFGFSGNGVGHAGPPRRPRRRRDRQQRDLGAGEASDGVPLRLLHRRRAAARDPLRRGRLRPRRRRRARAHARRARSGARARALRLGSRARQRAHRPAGRLPAALQPRVTDFASDDPARLQSALADIALLAVSGRDVSQLMEETVTVVHDQLAVDFATVVEFEDQGAQHFLRVRAGAGWESRPAGTRLEVLPNSPFEWTFRHGYLHMPDRTAETRFDAEHPTLIAAGIHASMSHVMPGARAGEPYGIIGVHSRPRREFTALEQEFLRGVAAVLAAAITRQRQALEVNDTVLQGLAVARYALERGDTALAEESVSDALDRARTLVSSLLGGASPDGAALPGDLRRR